MEWELFVWDVADNIGNTFATVTYVFYSAYLYRLSFYRLYKTQLRFITKAIQAGTVNQLNYFLR